MPDLRVEFLVPTLQALVRMLQGCCYVCQHVTEMSCEDQLAG